MSEMYGVSNAERDARQMLRCRQIVSEILNFGVSQQEILRIMNLLSLELENRELMLDLSERTKSAMNGSADSLGGLIVET
jgi:hypothetical protein